ncbi:MAG: DUF349 domain-containing protein [Tannerellaceae bacterium]|nr:DUF349 domain-containing protein [Tannerellaceae bacterium]
MKDTQETNLSIEETGKLEETKAPVTTPENTTEEVVSTESSEEVAEVPANEILVETVDLVLMNVTEEQPETGKEVATVAGGIGKFTKEEILNKLTELVEGPVESVRTEIESLKQAYYKLHRNEVNALKKAFIENGGEKNSFVALEDETESKIKELLAAYKEKRAAQIAEEEQQKATNYILKLQLIDRLKALTESQEDFNKLYNEFKEIQQKWKEIKAVSQEYANELWKNYQIYTEKFYDIIKINNQFRDYDFKKNLELKTALCEAVEKLEREPDIISAFHQLQKLHQQWREIGPVAKNLREEIWGRFKEASTVINKRHQEHFESLKAKEQDNLEAKTAICEEIESIDFDQLKTFKDWEAKNKEVIALQKKWKTIGFAPKKYNVKIFKRFRAACDVYFNKKSEYYKVVKEEMEQNLELKKALCEKAEALKDSTDWRETTEKMIILQKEWKTIGPVVRKYSDSIWKRFIAACDYFFEQKNKNISSQKGAEQGNLAAKKELIQKIKDLDATLEHEEALSTLKAYMAEWNVIGFVPFKEKDKIYKEYHEAIDKQFDRLKIDQSECRMRPFRSNINEIAGGEKGKEKLYGERERLMRTYDRMKNKLQTYENNIGFLSIFSKGGGRLVKEMERKIEKLKDEMVLIVKKIETIDKNLE